MNAMLPITPEKASAIVEAVITRGDLADLSDGERAKYYVRVCESVGLNPMTQPFAYITLTLYARKDATDQLRSLRGVSIEIIGRQLVAEVLTVHVRARDKDGRVDEDRRRSLPARPSGSGARQHDPEGDHQGQAPGDALDLRPWLAR
jgi:hypothetical protein